MFKGNQQPQPLKECLWRFFVVKSVIPKYKLIDTKSIKKSCSAYLVNQ